MKRISSSRVGSCPSRYDLRPLNAETALSPPPPISPRPTIPSSVSTSTMVRTKRPQCEPFAWRSGAASGTVTGVARMSVIFMSWSTESSWRARAGRPAVLQVWSYAAVDAEAAVHRNHRSGHERGGIAAEKTNDADELFRPAEAAHGCLGDHPLRTFGVLPVGRQEDVTVLRGDEEARRDGVDAEPVAVLARELDGHPPCEAVDAGLGDGVAED